MAIVIFMPLVPLLLVTYLMIIATSKGPAIYWSDRIGRHNKVFRMPKFRSMFVDTPSLATDLMKNPDLYVSNFGKFIRKYSIDEYPQFLSVIAGKMSIVGPRPALPSQNQLILGRIRLGIDKIKPGITGYAQINGRDKITESQKIKQT